MLTTIVSLILSSSILILDNGDVGTVFVRILSGRKETDDNVVGLKNGSPIGYCLF